MIFVVALKRKKKKRAAERVARTHYRMTIRTHWQPYRMLDKNECRTACTLTSTTIQHELAAGFDVWSVQQASGSVEGDNPHPLLFARPLRSVSHDCMRKLKEIRRFVRGDDSLNEGRSIRTRHATVTNLTEQTY